MGRLLRSVRLHLDALLAPPVDPRLVDEAPGHLAASAALAKLRRATAALTATRLQLALQSRRLGEERTRLDERARQAVNDGRDNLARTLLRRRFALDQEMRDLDDHLRALDAEATALHGAEQQLRDRIERLESRRQVVAARHDAAVARVELGELLAAVSPTGADLGFALDERERAAAHLAARADALDALIGEGLVPDLAAFDGSERTAGQPDQDIDDWIDRELATLKQAKNTDL